MKIPSSVSVSLRTQETMRCQFSSNAQNLDFQIRRRWHEREEYVKKVVNVEGSKQIDNMLSTTLDNHDVQHLAYAMRVYLDPGKLGFYDQVVEPFESE
jgi:hypothetical protein